MNKFIPDRKYTYIKSFLTENIVFFKKIRLRIEFEKFVVLLSTIRLNG